MPVMIMWHAKYKRYATHNVVIPKDKYAGYGNGIGLTVYILKMANATSL